MEPVFFLVAILGCTDDNVACRDARILPSRYATAAQCRAALPARLTENADLSFPSLQADCRASGPRVTSAAKGKPRG